MTKKEQHIVLTAGGTGGHMFPARALAEELTGRGHKVTLITDDRGAGFGEALPAFKIHRLRSAGVAGGSAFTKVSALWKIFLSSFKARQLLLAIEPDVVVGFGGYASVPATWAAGRLGLPLFLHEQNAVLGRANLLMARKARAIAVSFSKVAKVPACCQEKIVHTGNPVRAAIQAIYDAPYPALNGETAINLLVTGGSQGACVFNDLVPQALKALPSQIKKRLHVSQQVRGDYGDVVRKTYDREGIQSDVRAFFDDMPARLSRTHLTICRAGASTIAELSVAGCPAILVPYPFAADDHQTANANDVADAGGGWIMPQDSLSPETLAKHLQTLLDDPEQLKRSAVAAKSIAFPDVAVKLADIVTGLTKKTIPKKHKAKKHKAKKHKAKKHKERDDPR